jgi:nucleotide-binding universal stress UspA family protein
MQVPQPSPSRMTPFPGHPIVVGVRPDADPLVLLTAAGLAAATGARLVLGFVDEQRFVEEEFDDGSVRHADLNPDAADDSWKEKERQLIAEATAVLAESAVPWEFRYLAGRPDRALTHLARAVDAAVIVVGNHAPQYGAKLQEFLDGTLALKLAHHQHRPVLAVPLSVVDWKTRMPWR